MRFVFGQSDSNRVNELNDPTQTKSDFSELWVKTMTSMQKRGANFHRTSATKCVMDSPKQNIPLSVSYIGSAMASVSSSAVNSTKANSRIFGVMLRGAPAIKTNKMTQCAPAINALCFYINLGTQRLCSRAVSARAFSKSSAWHCRQI
jgi:hypothetical protein